MTGLGLPSTSDQVLPPTPTTPPRAAVADSGGWGGCSPSSWREEDKAYSPHS